MKLYVASDIHLEFGDCDFENRDSADVLILSGDICVAMDIGRPDPDNIMEGARSNRVRDFFQRCSDRFPHVIYVMGNHEHYHGDFGKTESRIREMIESSHLHNVYFLEKQTKTIDDVLFVGATLWTDFNRGDPLTMQHAAWGMNDFKGVKNSITGTSGGIWKFIPEHALEDHHRARDYIQTVLDDRREQGGQEKVVVVAHHGPSEQSVHPRYRDDYHVNGCYRSQLDEFIMDYPEIVLFTHGHTHEDFDYMIGETRVVCNPRGYVGHEARADTWQPKLVEI